MAILPKYDVPAPRYTSYPTVPFWQKTPPTAENWLNHVQERMAGGADLSLYIHLPYCEQLCTYCGCNKRITKNHAVESPYIDTLLAEWDLYDAVLPDRPTLRELHFGGGTPTFFSPESLTHLLEGLFQKIDLAPDVAMSFEAHPFSTTPAHLKAMARMGMKRISLGVQDIDSAILKLINRHQTLEQVENVTETARDLGYTSVNFDLIYGLPTQTLANIDANMDMVARLRPERIAFYSYAHVPWVSPSQRAYSEADLPSAIEKRALYEHGRTRMLDMGYVEVGMDHFALPTDDLAISLNNGSIHRNFMGYTPVATDVQIGLGASSISDSWNMFVQNEKKVETYQAAIHAGELPIIRGHELNEEDLLIRRHLLNLMCLGTTTFTPSERFIPVIEQGFIRLQEMQADGLVDCDALGVTLTEAGKPYLRNASMAFDARLWRAKPEVELFSKSI